MGRKDKTILAEMLMLLTSVIVLLLYDVWLTNGFPFYTCAYAVPAAWGLMLLFRTRLSFSATEQEKEERSWAGARLRLVSELLLLLMDLYVIRTVCGFFAFFYTKQFSMPWNILFLFLAGVRAWLTWLWHQKEK